MFYDEFMESLKNEKGFKVYELFVNNICETLETTNQVESQVEIVVEKYTNITNFLMRTSNFLRSN